MGGGWGYCRKSVPSLVGSVTSHTIPTGQWPSTMKDDWCGNFQYAYQRFGADSRCIAPDEKEGK